MYYNNRWLIGFRKCIIIGRIRWNELINLIILIIKRIIRSYYSLINKIIIVR